MDLDADGKLDLLTNSFDGGLYLAPGLGNGSFGPPEKVLDAAGTWLRLGRYWDYEERTWTTVATSKFSDEHGISGEAVDWDGDGDLDLLLGSDRGGVFLRRNEGTPQQAAFAVESERVLAAGEPLTVSAGHAMLDTADWDGDGRLDLLVGANDGRVFWYRNLAKDGAIELSKGVPLVGPGVEDAENEAEIRPGTRVQISAVDVNGDGRLDLLVGDHMMFRPPGPKLSEEQEAELEALRAERRELYERFAALREKHGDDADFAELAETDDEVAEVTERLEVVRVQISALDPPPQWRGWVWYFERKPAAG